MQKSLLSLMDMQSPWSCITQYYTPMANTAVSESKTVKSAQPRNCHKTLYHLRAGSGQKTTLRTYIFFEAPAYGAATCVLQDVFSSLPSFSEHLASSFLSQQANGGFAV